MFLRNLRHSNTPTHWGSTTIIAISNLSSSTVRVPVRFKQNETDLFMALKDFKDKIKSHAFLVTSHAIV